jgi:hypothetical protein
MSLPTDWAKPAADAFRRDAQHRGMTGWLWDVIGLLIGGSPLTLLLAHVLKTSDTGTTQVAVTRLAVCVGALVLAALCFARGSSNHKESRLARRVDIRLRTVGMFMEDQDPDFQEAIREGLTDRIFLQGILESERQKDDPSILRRSVERVRARRSRPLPAAPESLRRRSLAARRR